MGIKKRGVRDGTGPFSGRGIGRRKLAGGICPFDKDNVEDIKSMKVDLNVKGGAKVVSDKVGQGRYMK